jgi:hypothetical protein
MTLTRRFIIVAICLFVLVALAPALSAQQGADRVAAIKQWLAQSKAQQKGYQWIETTVVTLKGEVKSTKVSSCYYDVTGAVQKVPVSASPEPKKKFGIRGAIVANKTEEMTDYMKEAVALVKSYVPPTPEQIQVSKDAGKMSLDLLPGGQNVRVNFHDYYKPGDNLSVSVEMATNRLIGIGVATYIDDPQDAVVLAVTVAALPDGTGYPKEITLDAKAKKLTVTVTNSGYRKAGG